MNANALFGNALFAPWHEVASNGDVDYMINNFNALFTSC